MEFNSKYNHRNYVVEERRVNDHLTDFYITKLGFAIYNDDNYEVSRMTLHDKYLTDKISFIDNCIDSFEKCVKRGIVILS